MTQHDSLPEERSLAARTASAGIAPDPADGRPTSGRPTSDRPTSGRPAGAPSDPGAPDVADGRGRGRLITLSVLAGIVLSVIWSYEFVDTTIGATLADGVLGYDAKDTAISGSLAGAFFAFAAGLGGTFTACNIAAFSALGPMLATEESNRNRAVAVLKPLGWVSLGIVPVSVLYGGFGALAGDSLPQLSRDTVGGGEIPVRLLQSSVTYGILGLIFVYLGLAAAKIVPDPLAGLTRRFEQAPLVVMGVLIGLFLIGRPFPLFFKTFQYAAEQNSFFFGALAFTLVAIGNIAVMALLFLLLALPGRGAVPRWLTARQDRLAAITASGLIIAGTFTFVYWVVRLPANFDYGWFPQMPYNS